LVGISVQDLFKAEIASKTDEGIIIADCIKKGQLVDDDIVVELIEQRIQKSDCRINGWILDGFPMSLP
jgi:adenylate kinase